MADWYIEPLAVHHDRTTFQCGQPALDDFFRSRVSHYAQRHLGKTFVAISCGQSRVIGFYTLADGAIAFGDLPAGLARKLPRQPLPVVLLAPLAVDLSAQGQRIGEGLLLDTRQRSLELSQNLGVHAVQVDSIDEAAACFCLKYGFVRLHDHPNHLVLP